MKISEKLLNFITYFNSFLLLVISLFILYVSYLAFEGTAVFIWAMGFIAFGCIQHLVGLFKRRKFAKLGEGEMDES